MDQAMEGSSKQLKKFELEHGEIGASTSDLKESSKKWSLDGDIKLLGRLKELSNSLMEKTESTDQAISNLVHESNMRRVEVSNVINEFQMLSSTQFMESRVYDEEVDDLLKDANQVDSTPSAKTKEQKEAEVVPKIRHAVEVSCRLTAPALEVMKNYDDCDSDEEEGNYWSNKVPLDIPWKSQILNRPLPYLIGSEDYIRDPFAGVGGAMDEPEGQQIDAYDERISDDEGDDDEIFEAEEATMADQRDEAFNPLLNNFAQSNENASVKQPPIKPGLFDDLLSNADESDEDGGLFSSSKPVKLQNPVEDKIARDAQPEKSPPPPPQPPNFSAPSFQDELSKAIRKKANLVNEHVNGETSPLLSSTSKASSPSKGSLQQEPSHSNHVPEIPSRRDSMLSTEKSRTSNIFADDSSSEDDIFSFGSKIKSGSTSTPKGTKNAPRTNNITSLFDDNTYGDEGDLFSRSSKVSNDKEPSRKQDESRESNVVTTNHSNQSRPHFQDKTAQKNPSAKKSLFDDSDSDEDSIFGNRTPTSSNVSQAKTAAKVPAAPVLPPKIEVSSSKVSAATTPIASANSNRSESILKVNPPRKAASNLFSDSDDDETDLFKSSRNPATFNQTKSKPVAERSSPVVAKTIPAPQPKPQKIADYENRPEPLKSQQQSTSNSIVSTTATTPSVSNAPVPPSKTSDSSLISSRSEYLSDQEDTDEDLFAPRQKDLPDQSDSNKPPASLEPSNQPAPTSIAASVSNEPVQPKEAGEKNEVNPARSKINVNKFGSAQTKAVPLFRDELASVLGGRRKIKSTTEDSESSSDEPSNVTNSNINHHEKASALDPNTHDEHENDDDLFKPIAFTNQTQNNIPPARNNSDLQDVVKQDKENDAPALDCNFSRDKAKVAATRQRRPPSRKPRGTVSELSREPIPNLNGPVIPNSNEPTLSKVSAPSIQEAKQEVSSRTPKDPPKELSKEIPPSKPNLDLSNDNISKLNMLRSPSTEEEDLLPSDVISGQRQTFSPLGRTSKSLFDDEDEDLFAKKPAAKPNLPKVAPKEKEPILPASTPQLAPQPPKASVPKKPSLFSDDDEDDDIFTPKVSSRQPPPQNSSNHTNQSGQATSQSKPASKSIFSDDDDDDFFTKLKGNKNQGGTKTASSANRPAATKYTAKSLFDDDEDDEDLFSTSRLRK